MSASDTAEANEPTKEDAPDRADRDHGEVEQTNLKRKAESPLSTEAEDIESKRPKTEASGEDTRRRSRDVEENSPASRRDSATKPPDRRKDFAQEDKKRGQRLFGGLLSTLNRSGPNSQQKKRLDIERRQQERAKDQRAEEDKRRAHRLAKLKNAREIQQVSFDEQVMRTRHATMRSQARSLRTQSRPYIYYRPWELSSSQERTILKQMKDAETAIADEIEKFSAQKAQRLADLGVAPPAKKDAAIEESLAADSTSGERAIEKSNPTDEKREPTPKDMDEYQHDDRGVMVVTEEDTVIY